MSSVRPLFKSANPQQPPAAQPLPLGAHVHLRLREATGVVIGNSPEADRVQVQWDDTGEVTHCLKANLELAASE